jgi:NADPH:quinone reductase-like Zn-dependent oxidoreductase
VAQIERIWVTGLTPSRVGLRPTKTRRIRRPEPRTHEHRLHHDRSVVLPKGIDPVQVAAAMNPAMSAWVALRRRIDFQRRQRLLILGATGNAGRMAIQVAKRFGAAQVIAAGRDTTRLAELHALGADETCTFDDLAKAASTS